MLSYVLCNKDNRVISHFLEKFKSKFDYQNTLVNFDFLDLDSKYKNKIKKFKILTKFIDLKNQKRNILHHFQRKKFHINLIKYIIKKIFDNNLLKESEDILTRLFEEICINVIK